MTKVKVTRHPFLDLWPEMETNLQVQSQSRGLVPWVVEAQRDEGGIPDDDAQDETDKALTPSERDRMMKALTAEWTHVGNMLKEALRRTKT